MGWMELPQIQELLLTAFRDKVRRTTKLELLTSYRLDLNHNQNWGRGWGWGRIAVENGKEDPKTQY